MAPAPNATLGHGVTAAQLTLDQLVQVRILVPQLEGGVRSREARSNSSGAWLLGRLPFFLHDFIAAGKLEGMSMALLEEYVTLPEAAQEIGITPGRLRQMLRAGELEGEKVGPVWVIPRSEVERLKNTPRTTGRPRIGER